MKEMDEALSKPGRRETISSEELMLEGFLDPKAGQEPEDLSGPPLKTLETLKRQKDVQLGRSTAKTQPEDLFSEAHSALTKAESLNPMFLPKKNRAGARPRPLSENLGESSVPAQRQKQIQGQSLPSFLPEPSFCALPPLELFEPSQQSREVFLQFAYELEQNLAGLGAGAAVKQIHPSTRYTRFTLQPQEGVRPEKIVSLCEEIGLRMRIPTPQIQAGKGNQLQLVVKNRKILPIPLRNLLSHSSFSKVQGGIPVALGRGADHAPVVLDLAALPHLLIGGRSGTGKSVLMDCILTSILFCRTPQQVRLLLCSDGESLREYSALPHLLLPLCQDPGGAHRAFLALVQEVKRRMQLFHSLGVGSLHQYQRRVLQQGEGKTPPRIVLCVDELSYALKTHGEESREALKTLALEGERVGIHLVLSSSEPMFWQLPGETLSLFPSRACFQTESALLSRMVIGSEQAMELEPEGEVFLALEQKPPFKMQGAYVFPEEKEKLRRFFQGEG